MKKTSFAAGMLVGAVVFGGIAATAAGITATLSAQKFYVDGKATEFTAYSIGGNNYIKLRDIGRAVNFGVIYDSVTNSVYIDRNSPYVEESPTPAPTESAHADVDLAEFAAEVVRLTNIERENVGLPALKVSAALSKAAMRKSQDMVDYDYVGHDSPTFGLTKTIVELSNWRFMGENVADGGFLPEHAVMDWTASKGHKENILRKDTTHIGVGVAIAPDGSFRWTQLFGENINE
jgi:uncharacterized protein YkwD